MADIKILVTGAKGFIGKNLCARLHYLKDVTVYEYDKDTPREQLEVYCKNADFVFHLAGVNRPEKQEEYRRENGGFSEHLLDLLKKYKNFCPVMLSSSIQASLQGNYTGSLYGESKKEGEEAFFRYGSETMAPVYVYRFPNVFGKWCRPNYNSVIATFCHNIARGLPIQINGRETQLEVVYIDDLVDELLRALQGNATKGKDGYCYVPVTYKVSLGEIADLLYDFRDSRNSLNIPDMTKGSFSKKLYAAYLSYLSEEQFSHPLTMHTDNRGSFTELFRTADRGQFSVNITKPGIAKGEHWHNTKNEKFIVVHGEGLIQFRKVGSNKIIEYPVSGEKIEAVDIPVGYTHRILNTGNDDLVTFMWCNECFEPENTDTYVLTVREENKFE